MTANNLCDLRSNFLLAPLGNNAIGRRLCGLIFILAVTLLASVSAAQKTKSEPTLVPGSEVNLAAVKAADWIQGEGPTAFEPGKVYVFECWATWCGPCIAMIPHVNELHKKYYDQGLRVHGISWENDKDLVKAFVKKKGAGMSYPVALAIEGSAFESEWIKAAGVKSIPHAFVVRNGKLLLATEANRLTESLIETILSGDEGAKQAAAKIKAAYDARGKVEALAKQFRAAARGNDAETMAAKLKELETIDAEYYELPQLNLDLLMVRKQWPALTEALNEMPLSESKNFFILKTVRKVTASKTGTYPMDFLKALATEYSKYAKEGGKKIGPNHFAYLSAIHWMVDDKETAIGYADQGVEVAINFARPSEARTNAFKRFAKSAKEGTMPKVSELMAWQIEARNRAKAAADK